MLKQNVNSLWKLTQTLVRRLLRVPDMITLLNKSNPYSFFGKSKKISATNDKMI